MGSVGVELGSFLEYQRFHTLDYLRGICASSGRVFFFSVVPLLILGALEFWGWVIYHFASNSQHEHLGV